MASPFAIAQFGGNLVGAVRRFELLQRYESHTVAIVDLAVPSRLLRMPDAAFYPEMTPVTVRWGYRPNGAVTFFGYVNHSEVLNADTDGSAVVRYVCLGSSLPMNVAAPRSWSRITASAVVAQIAARHRLRAVLHRSTKIMTSFTLTTESDFQALQRLAAETGYRVWVDGGTVFFLDPQVLLSGSNVQSGGVFDNVGDFHITSGSMVPRPGGVIGRAVIQGRHPGTKIAFTVKSDTVLKNRPTDPGSQPFLTTVLPGEVGTYAEARQRVQAVSRSQNWLTAAMSLPGAPSARPGRLLWITDRRVPADHLGVWTIEAARHVVTTGSFSTEVEISRNQGRRPDFPMGAPLAGTREEVGCIRRANGLWESELLDTVQLS